VRCCVESDTYSTVSHFLLHAHSSLVAVECNTNCSNGSPPPPLPFSICTYSSFIPPRVRARTYGISSMFRERGMCVRCASSATVCHFSVSERVLLISGYHILSLPLHSTFFLPVASILFLFLYFFSPPLFTLPSFS
jgi:hypothetical protein